MKDESTTHDVEKIEGSSRTHWTIHWSASPKVIQSWIPAFAGMTRKLDGRVKPGHG